MNKCIFTGRLTRDPEVRYSQGSSSTAIASFSLAVQRKFKREGEPDADFLNFKAFGKIAEHIEKFWHKGMKMDVVAHCQTGSYEKDGKKVYTTDFIVDEIEFGESKNTSGSSSDGGFNPPPASNGFKPVSNNDFPPFNADEDLPFAPISR